MTAYDRMLVTVRVVHWTLVSVAAWVALSGGALGYYKPAAATTEADHAGLARAGLKASATGATWQLVEGAVDRRSMATRGDAAQ